MSKSQVHCHDAYTAWFFPHILHWLQKNDPTAKISPFSLNTHPHPHMHTTTQPHCATFHDRSVISRSWGCRRKGKTVDYFSRSSYSIKFKVCVIAKMTISQEVHIQSSLKCVWLQKCINRVIRVVNGILSALNNDNFSVLLLLDLSAAFDTVDHQILLSC